jgi:hypothetical protein
MVSLGYGIRLFPKPVAPQAAKGRPCWNHMLQTRQVGVYVPSAFPNPELQVLVVLDN